MLVHTIVKAVQQCCMTMIILNALFDVTQDLFNTANFSSLGPTVDGRTKPDISAPGNRIVSSISSYDNNYNSPSSGQFDNTATYSDIVSGLNKRK